MMMVVVVAVALTQVQFSVTPGNTAAEAFHGHLVRLEDIIVKDQPVSSDGATLKRHLTTRLPAVFEGAEVKTSAYKPPADPATAQG